MQVLAEATKGRWFTDAFRETSPETVDRMIAMLTSTPPDGYAACCEALATFDSWFALPSGGAPVRGGAGADDPVATPAVCEEMASVIPGADLVVVRDCSHIAPVGQPEAFARAVVEHLEKHL